MSNKLLKLTITRVDGPVFDGEVISVSVPSLGGIIQILANHEPLISPLKSGEVKIKKADDTEETFSLKNGTLEVSYNHATILI
jgi:F-type H+-transporting ATPase subunit epsilon